MQLCDAGFPNQSSFQTCSLMEVAHDLWVSPEQQPGSSTLNHPALSYQLPAELGSFRLPEGFVCSNHSNNVVLEYVYPRRHLELEQQRFY
jgi:hypothetical protein